jgi:hypothetical protein
MLLGSIFKGQNLSSVFCAPRLSAPDVQGGLTAFPQAPRLFEIDVVIVSLKGCVHGGPLWICILESVVLFC